MLLSLPPVRWSWFPPTSWLATSNPASWRMISEEAWTTTTATGSARDWSLFKHLKSKWDEYARRVQPQNACCHGNSVPGYERMFPLLQVFEKFTKESTSLLDELSIINESDKSSSVDKDKYVHTHTHVELIRGMTDKTHSCVSVCRLQISRLRPVAILRPGDCPSDR